ncbi:MAG: LCP family protein, partial [Armatimonadota bacterium]|nr:LCP family protein [Armatimonadota bacterium]
TGPQGPLGGAAVSPPRHSPVAWPARLARRTTVLVIGVDVTLDTRRQIVPVARSDTLMLVGFDPLRRRVSVLSIPRDTLVTIPGVGEAKINAAYAFGGPALTIRTVEEFLGVPVHYYVKLGPQSFARLIDALGGIEVDVEKDMTYTDRWAGLYINLRRGRQRLSGEQAMHYIRFRHDPEGDIGRVRRQQQVLRAIIDHLRSPRALGAAPRLVQAASRYTQTNLSLRELVALGLFALRLPPDALHTATVPGQVGPVYVFHDPAATRALVAEMFLGVDPRVLAATTVEVLNASGLPGLARDTAARLERLGFRVVRVGTAPPAARTEIVDRSNHPEVAQALADLLGPGIVTRQESGRPDITVVVARDLAPAIRRAARVDRHVFRP